MRRNTLSAIFASSVAAVAFAVSAVPAHASRADTAALASSSHPSPRTSADCAYYLRSVGYAVGPQRTQACNDGASGVWAAWGFCYARLVDGGVSKYHADKACVLAESG
jgi:hypothetical protein